MSRLTFLTKKEALIFVYSERNTFNFNPDDVEIKKYTKAELIELFQQLYGDIRVPDTRKQIIQSITRYTWDISRTLAFDHRTLSDLREEEYQ